MISSMLAPYSRFSKMTEIGIRVSRSTHAPPTRSGTLSTAAHCDQSSVPVAIGWSLPRLSLSNADRCAQTRQQAIETYVLIHGRHSPFGVIAASLSAPCSYDQVIPCGRHAAGGFAVLLRGTCLRGGFADRSCHGGGIESGCDAAGVLRCRGH